MICLSGPHVSECSLSDSLKQICALVLSGEIKWEKSKSFEFSQNNHLEAATPTIMF